MYGRRGRYPCVQVGMELRIVAWVTKDVRSALERVSSFPASLIGMVTEREFLHHIAQAGVRSTPFYRANLFKRRSRFTIQDCAVKVDHILVNGAAIQSIAVESGHAEAQVGQR